MVVKANGLPCGRVRTSVGAPGPAGRAKTGMKVGDVPATEVDGQRVAKASPRFAAHRLIVTSPAFLQNLQSFELPPSGNTDWGTKGRPYELPWAGVRAPSRRRGSSRGAPPRRTTLEVLFETRPKFLGSLVHQPVEALLGRVQSK